MAVKHKVIERHDSADEVKLNIIIRVLETINQQKQCYVGTDREKTCEKIVTNLGTIAMPNTTEEYIPFMAQIIHIQDVLTRALSDEEMIVATLRALYNEISNKNKQPTPTMSIVLHLIDIQYIPNAVKWILHSGYEESSLEQALLTLCTWLSKWTLTPNLGPLVLEFMRGLESERHYDILINATLKHVESLFKLVILPDIRKSLGPVVLHMLSCMQHSPNAFHQIIPHVKNVLDCLSKENSESSRMYLQNVVNLCFALMEHFPGYPFYDQLRQTLQPFSTPINYKQSLVNTRSWLDSSNPSIPMQFTPGKVGLNNLGNTCYMNSVLQALFMTKPFRNDILLSNRDTMPLFSKLQALFALLQYSERSSLSPSEIATVARPPGFQPGHQHDSSEFLGYLLDILHEQEKSIYNSSGDTPSSSETSSSVLTVVKKSFGGRILTLSQCNNCDTRSERADTFRDLQLSFPSNTDNQSVQTLVDYYLQPEKLCGDNQYHCDTCRGLTDGERVTKIIDPPPRLVLTLKHFRYDPVTQLRTKILQRVKLDDNLVLENVQYKLYTAVVHCGSSVDSGHYYTYAKDGLDWYKFNDCFVLKSKAEELRGLCPPEAPYILFYSRIDCDDPEALNRCELSPRLQNILIRDNSEFESEQRRPQLNFNKNRQNRNDDPPPPGCGGGGFLDSPHNRFVC